MNIAPNSRRAASQAAHAPPAFFTQDSYTVANRLVMAESSATRFKPEMPTMRYRNVDSRARYANVLYAAAVAALLSACSQSGISPAQDAEAGRTIHLSESSSELPEIVITASRERPKAHG